MIQHKFIDPKDKAPPMGQTILIKTSGGTVILGKWVNIPGYEKWFPIPK